MFWPRPGWGHLGWFAWHQAAADWYGLFIALGTVTSAAILLATVLVARGALDDAQRTRHGQLVVELASRWNSPLVVEALKLMGEIPDQDILTLVETLYASDEIPTEADLKRFSKLSA